MKKIPRNLTGQALIKKLKKLGYSPSRQTGSHIRITTEENSTHHLTIPNHSPLKNGTLSNILNDVAIHFKISKEQLIDRIFLQLQQTKPTQTNSLAKSKVPG